MTDLQQDAVETKSIEAEKPTKTLERKNKIVFNQCCFCVPLRTGCLILAYLFLVGTIVIAIFTIHALVGLVAWMLHASAGVNHILTIFLVLNAVTLVLAVIAIPFSILLLVGLHKERRSFVKNFIIFQLANIILTLLQNIVTFSLGYMNIVGIVIALAGLVFNIYFILMMTSHYVKMGEAANKLPGILYRHGHEVDTP
ncbi:uncharacterized protein [Maniola hyperantus]|uniref:uncharacterized protein n=1 Tax=Aphantopus hyperantus TaxID=2795564 RepID=UPI003747FE8F